MDVSWTLPYRESYDPEDWFLSNVTELQSCQEWFNIEIDRNSLTAYIIVYAVLDSGNLHV